MAKRKEDEAIANVKLQRISPHKARLVARLFKNKDISEAISILQNTNKKSTILFLRLLNSAIANAVNNHGMNAEKLFVNDVIVNKGPTLKRFQTRSQGRSYPILKRTAHLTVAVKEKE
jgi:large subunit ribosomal protein L22